MCCDGEDHLKLNDAKSECLSWQTINYKIVFSLAYDLTGDAHRNCRKLIFNGMQVFNTNGWLEAMHNSVHTRNRLIFTHPIQCILSITMLFTKKIKRNKSFDKYLILVFLVYVLVMKF